MVLILNNFSQNNILSLAMRTNHMNINTKFIRKFHLKNSYQDIQLLLFRITNYFLIELQLPDQLEVIKKNKE